MKNNIKVITITTVLILASALILTGCMYALAAAPLEEKDYNMDEFVDKNLFVSAISNGPEAQSELQEKFAVYNFESTDENGGQTLTLFSKDQYDTITEKRTNGERFFLTYDEVLFIINDSIQMYNKYDTVILTNAADIFENDSLGDAVISAYHGDYSEISYQAATEKYEQMISDIYNIIIYRLSMLDSGFTKAYHVSGLSSTWESDKLTFEYDSNKMIDETLYVLSVDEGVISNRQEYLNEMVEAYNNYRLKTRAMLSAEYHEEGWDATLKYPLLVSVYGGYEISLIDTDAFTVNKLFPTNELDAMEPLREIYSVESDNITVSLHRTDSSKLIGDTIKLTGTDAKQLIEAYNDKCLESETQDNASVGDYDCFYRVDFNNGTVIYLPPDNAGYCINATDTFKISVDDPYSDPIPVSFAKLIYDLYQ